MGFGFSEPLRIVGRSIEPLARRVTARRFQETLLRKLCTRGPKIKTPQGHVRNPRGQHMCCFWCCRYYRVSICAASFLGQVPSSSEPAVRHSSPRTLPRVKWPGLKKPVDMMGCPKIIHLRAFERYILTLVRNIHRA